MTLQFHEPRRRLLIAAAGLLAAPASQAQTAPRPGRLIVPFAPGGASDVLARALVERTQERLGPLLVEHRIGMRGSLGTELVAKAAPDGSALLLGSVVTHAINPWIGAGKLYDPVADFTPIALLARIPNVLVMNSDTARRLGVANVSDLIAYALKNPGRLSCGSSGMGSTGHLAAELLKARSGIVITHQPYAGFNPALRGLLAGEVDFSFQDLASASASIRNGKLRALALSAARRSSYMPELPTLAESPARLGLGGFDIGLWFGLFGPARLAPELTLNFNIAFTEALSTPELRERLDLLKAEATPSTPEQLGSLVRLDLARHEVLARRSGSRLE